MKTRLSAFAGTLLLIPILGGAQDRPTTIDEFYETGSRRRIIAHRGFSGAAPENTIAAVRAAIEIGADMVEIDVTLSADGYIVVIHDETLERTTDGRGEVSRLTLAELKQLDAGSWFDTTFAGERIPTLDEVLAEVEGKILLNVEIKGEAVDRGVVPKVTAAIRAHEMIDRVVVSSFSPAVLAEMQVLAPKISTAVLFNTEFHEDRDPVEIVNDLGALAFNIKRRRLTHRMLHRCAEHRIPVGVYTVNTPRRMRRLIEKGVHAIFSDQPDRLLKILDATPTTVPTPNPLVVAPTSLAPIS